MEFVVGASEATMKSLLGKLGSLLAQEYSLIRGVRGDIQYINDELATMQAFLGDLGSALDDHDRRLKSWMKQIRDMAYDMEDCVDDFAHRLPQDSLSDARCSFIMTAVYEVWTFWPRRDIASKISKLKIRAQHIAERRSRYGVDNPTRSSSRTEATHAVTYVIAEHLMARRQLIHTENPVGVKVDMDKLRGWLTKQDKGSHRVVVSLIGFGGVGKTTIAMALYRDFRNGFDCRASVTVSQNFDEDEVLRDILGQIKATDSQTKQEEEHEDNITGKLEKKNLVADIKSSVKRIVPLLSGHRLQSNDGTTHSKIETMNRDQLIVELRKRLLGRRYLLLIDDIWSVETWGAIRQWLPHDNNNATDSRVIVTSRFQAVGAACSERTGTDYLHTVNVLSDAESKSLFHQGISESQSKEESERKDARSQAVGTESSVGDGNADAKNLFNHISGAQSSKEGERKDTRSKVVDTESSEGDGIDHLQSADVPSVLNNRVSDQQSSEGKEKEEIWKYCGGLPLAIVTMAGLVACNPKKNNDHWSKVCKSIFPEQVAPLTLEGVSRILDYCYNDLPADLKTCSLYLSIFPKGSKISKKRLTRRWISECFVAEKQGLSAEEVAETYFNQLVSRKIIRPVDHSSNGKVKSFKVHDMILEYIVSKSSEENFITVVGGHWLMPTPSNKVRRLSMQSSGSKHENSTKGMNLSQVRSLTVFGSQNRRLPFHSFNNGIIQMLDLEGWKGLTDKHLKGICKMLVLKYLSLRRTEVTEIPSKIEKLQYLETLDIRETNVEVLPKAFGQLKRLRSMLGGSKNPRKALKLPDEKNKEPMKALCILSGIEIGGDSSAVASLHQLTGLRKLGIYKLNKRKGDQTFTQLRSAIEYLCSCGLQTLVINDESSEFINSLDTMSAPPRYIIGLELSGKMEKPPKWIENLENLFKLTLSMTVLKTDTFKLIQKLSKLFSLTFTLSAPKDDRDIVDILQENKQLTGREIIIPPGGFKNLKLLRFFATLVPRLSFAVTGEEVMPTLERIDMRFQAFEGIYGIETLKCLQEVHLSVGNQADEITKLLVQDLKDTPKYLDEMYASKWPKIITE
ncbi:disease resistance protein Pik-2-like [Triticum dicoccoides]|uniref:disease resistance protein Pik-2-like n=1 Tax=Triticum dicoccoides TaxID=85692 RepID=UPI000E79CECC|nr:disease resistance protein Pik-2-like [Triticum dicoccoides]XP_037423944.1 disease resistance protein Pik-2-like [Triticum dicoccoides]